MCLFLFLPKLISIDCSNFGNRQSNEILQNAIRHCVTPGGFATATVSGGRRAESGLPTNLHIELLSPEHGTGFRAYDV
jgi:hypothetical protein